MALRTAEGKAAVADLLNGDSKQGKKPMAFAQYFGAPGSKATQVASGSSSPRVHAAQDAPRAPLSVRMGLKPSGLRPSGLDQTTSGSNKNLANVPEDEEAASVSSPPPVSHICVIHGIFYLISHHGFSPSEALIIRRGRDPSWKEE